MAEEPQKEKSTNTPRDTFFDEQKNSVKELSLKRNMIWNSAGSITFLICQYFITVLLVRVTGGYSEANTFSYAATIYSYFMPLAIYRMYTYQVSDVKHENSLGEYLTFRILTSGGALIACIVFAALTSPPSVLPSIVLYAIYKTISLVIDILHGTDQLNRRMDYIGKSFILQGVGSLAVFGGVFIATNNLEAALVGMIIVTVVVGAAYDYPRTRQFERIKLGISRKKAQYLLKICFPIVIAAVACAAVPSIPRQLLVFAPGDLLGIYMQVAAPATIIQMGASYLYGPLINVFSEQYIEGRTKDLKKTLVKVSVGIAIFGIVCIVGLELFGPFVLILLNGPVVEPYMYLLLPIALSIIVSAYVWFFSDLLVALRCFKGSFVGNFVALIVAVPAAYFFVGTWDMNGVSFTVIISYGIGVLVMAFYILAALKRSSLTGKANAHIK